MRRQEIFYWTVSDQWHSQPTNGTSIRSSNPMPCFHIWMCLKMLPFHFVWRRLTRKKSSNAWLKFSRWFSWRFWKRSIRKLSGGQRQRVAIARAIINQPRVVLLDEPLSALDLKLRTDMQYELRELQQRLGITFVFVTHDQEEALAMSDWIFRYEWWRDCPVWNASGYLRWADQPLCLPPLSVSQISCQEPWLRTTWLSFNGKRFEAVDGGMKPNEPVEVVIRPEDLQITLPEEGKLQVKVDTQLFRGVHYEIIAYDEFGNEWMIHSTRKAIVGEKSVWTLNQKTSTSCVSTKRKKSSMLVSKNT